MIINHCSYSSRHRDRQNIGFKEEIVSGFVNIQHNRNSHEDKQIPVYLQDQKLFITEEELYLNGYVKEELDIDPASIQANKDNSLVLTLCINQAVKNYGLLDNIFINDVSDGKILI